MAFPAGSSARHRLLLFLPRPSSLSSSFFSFSFLPFPVPCAFPITRSRRILEESRAGAHDEPTAPLPLLPPQHFHQTVNRSTNEAAPHPPTHSLSSKPYPLPATRCSARAGTLKLLGPQQGSEKRKKKRPTTQLVSRRRRPSACQASVSVFKRQQLQAQHLPGSSRRIPVPVACHGDAPSCLGAWPPKNQQQ